MEQTEKRFTGKHLFLILVLLLVIALVALPFILDRMSESANDGASILSATVARGDISRTVSGAGTLDTKEAVELRVPEGVVITGYLVSDGDLVKEGDPVASVDPVSVYKAAADLSDTLDAVTEELAELQHSDSTSKTISSNVEGTVTAVYAQTGDDVREIMNEYGALCEITLKDGTVLKVTATSGTIAWANVREGSKVFSGNTLYSVSGADSTGSYGSLVLKRRKIEDQIAQLFQMYRDGYAAAPADGMISGLDESLVKELSAENGGGLRVTLLSNFVPDSGMELMLLSGGSDNKVLYSTQTLDGKLGEDGKNMGIPADVDLSAFPEAKPGDTVIVICNTYAAADADGNMIQPIVLLAPEYEAFYVVSNKSDSFTPGGMGGFGGGGGGMSFGGSMGGSADADEAEASLATTLIASVVPTDAMLVNITVDELDILSLHEGDKAQVTIDALPGRSFEGVVTGVNTGLSNSGGNSKYTVEVTVPREDDMLAGMNASCLVTVETFRGVLSIPAAAVCDEADGAQVYTAVSHDGAALLQPVRVELGFSDGENVEVLDGLSEGQTIWYSTYDTPEYSVPKASGRSSGGLFGGGSRPRV